MNIATTASAITGTAALALYATSTLLLYRNVRKNRSTEPGPGNTSKIWLIAVAAVVLHGVTLLASTFKPDGLNLAFLNSLSVTAWCTVAITLLWNTGRPVINLGLVLFPLTAIVLLVAILFGHQQQANVDPGLQWHVLTSVVAYSLLTMAAVQAVLVRLQNNRLHDHRPGGFLQNLPPLAVMEKVLFQLLGATFILLTLSLLTGFVFLDDLFAQRLVHKTTLSIIAWLIIGILLTGHFIWGWRGQKASTLTIGAFFALLLGYFGSKLVLELILTAE